MTVTISFDDLADLSPNMRKCLLANEQQIFPKTTYWITLQGMIARGLVEPPANR